MADTRKLAELGMATPLAKEVATQIDDAVADKAQVVALTNMTVTATSGTLPTPNNAVTIANAATPTVAELLEFCVELNAKIVAMTAALKA